MYLPIEILFFAGCVILASVIIYVFLTVRNKIRSISRMAFGTTDIIKGFKRSEEKYKSKPKSLSGMDTFVLPRVIEDFPDFNVDLAKSYAKDALEKHLKNPDGFYVHNVVLRDYKDYNNEKTIVMQAAVEYNDKDGEKTQKRYSLNYTYLLVGNGYADGANCPNCGAAASVTGSQVCEYCGSRVAEVLKNTWKFTDIVEK